MKQSSEDTIGWQRNALRLFLCGTLAGAGGTGRYAAASGIRSSQARPAPASPRP